MIIQLDTTLPSSVVVRDIQGNTARVAVDYPRPPPKCLNCGRFGHLLSRCPKPLMKNPGFKKNVPSGSKEVTHPTVVLPSSVEPADKGVQDINSIVSPRISKPRRTRSRSKKRSRSTPPRIQMDSKLLHDSTQSSIASGSQVKLDEVMGSISFTGRINPKSPVVDPSTKVCKVSPVKERKKKEEVSLGDKGSEIPLFSPPPGWEIMSSKTKKKLQQKWRNSCRHSEVFAGARVKLVNAILGLGCGLIKRW